MSALELLLRANNERFLKFYEILKEAVDECEMVNDELSSLKDTFENLGEYKEYVNEKTSQTALFSSIAHPKQIQEMRENLNALLSSATNVVNQYSDVLNAIQKFFCEGIVEDE